MVRAQRDLLPEANLTRVREAVQGLRDALRQGGGGAVIETGLAGLEKAVQKNLRSYPHPTWRENIEVLLVTGAVVLALRTFFVQPMAIPTGSAQPTLWGIVPTSLRGDPDAPIPGPIRRYTIDQWWYGISYLHKVARADGQLRDLGRPSFFLPFWKKQTLTIGDEKYTIRFPSSFSSIEEQCAKAGDPLRKGDSFRKGEDIIKLKVVAGDHLFVNRVIYNFRPPRRGEIVVFSSEGMARLIQDTHYIKRLVALPGESVRIGDDRHLIIDGRRLSAADPGFENVYGFDPKTPPRKSQYSGHLNDSVARRYGRPGIAPLFPNEDTAFVVPDKHYLAIGDNTLDSHDGRSWGAFPQEKLVGRASFVFWPISDRFGWGYR
jgi:signal peptidase I